ncbi:peptide ABC transporter substrate-binding protein [Chelatococcus sp. SYSU_G07232]|uniref:Peptide ABC transporter substrate-binding protein n=1 Tax=Chelatococcus albus TaxID=3047466 RepID=A0ABT7AGN1_9HYPH|nr:peptide ABC transporter substrate-binding protein [Chelatococcus sp. SYSU_G07232]MDJ1158524.1 peptide ABC transporter substrate-binding protein [Chelatococcus sp. SYSU_G07232]
MGRPWKLSFISAIASFAMTGLAAAEVVYHRGNAGEPKTLDQHQTSIDVEKNVLKDLYEGLVAYNPKGEIIPGVAESWSIGGDGTVYTFKLRDAGKWSNGDPVKASDFVYSFRRIMNPATAAKYANLLYPIKNAEKVNKGELKPEELGVKAADDKTLVITLERPTPYFLELLQHQTGLPLHQASVEKFGKDFVKPGNLVSNGAYLLAENVPNDHIKLTKNPNYWNAKSVQIDTVFFYPTEDNAAAVRRFMAGELDTNYQFPIDQLPFLREKLGAQVRTPPYLALEYYAINVTKPPFNDPRVRKALSMAVDRDYLAEKVWGGAALPAYNIVPPGLNGYALADVDYKSLSQLDREDQAKALLKEAGYGPGGKPLKIEIRYNTNESHKKTATAVADMWKTVLGAEVTLLNTDVKTHYAHLQNRGDFDVARAGWVADYSDPQNFLFLGLSNNRVGNYSQYNSAAFDAAMAKSDVTIDPAERMKVLRTAEDTMMKDGPIIPLLNRASLHLVSNRVKGWVDNVQNDHRSQDLRIER